MTAVDSLNAKMPTERQSAFVGADADSIAFAAHLRRRAMRRKILPIGATLLILALWEAAVVVFGIPRFIAPAPSAIVVQLYTSFDVLMANLWPTMIEAIAGYALGNLLAVAVAVLFVWKATAEEALFPIAVMVNTIPVVAKAPILVLLLGNGMEPKIAIAALICFFPTLVNVTRGLRDVNPQHLELMHVLSASQREIFLKLRLRNCLPYLFSALKITASTAVIGAIVGEWIGANVGLGALIIQATYNFDSPLLYATIVVGSLFSAAFFGAVCLVERRVMRNSGRTAV